MSSLELLKAECQDFMAKYHYNPSEFGRMAVNDPSFVPQLMSDRAPTLPTADRVRDFMSGGPDRHSPENRLKLKAERLELFQRRRAGQEEDKCKAT